MAVALQDHIHLFEYTGQTALTGPEHDSSKHQLLMPGMDEKIETAVHVERGLTGVSHTYRLLNAGNPVKYNNGALQLMATTAEKDALKALSGKTCWLMLNDHDDVGTPVNGSNGYKVVMTVTNSRMVNSSHDYWYVFVQITDVTL